MGTTHADYCHGPLPCTRLTTAEEIQTEYEANKGHAIVEQFNNLAPQSFPWVLVASHGPFTWGPMVLDAVENAAILEYLARLASETLHIRPDANPMQATLLDKHYLRKHVRDAYYEQKRATVNTLDAHSCSRESQTLEAL